MKNNNFHSGFQFNGRSFTESKEIIEYVEFHSKEAYVFLKEWFSDQEHVVVKTSGSTGTPKEIFLQKEQMINSALATGKYFGLSEGTSALCCLPINFIAGKMMLVRALTLGWKIDVVAPNSNPLEGIDKSYDFSAMVPLQLRNSLDKINQIETLIVGGGIVSEDLQKEIQGVSTHIYATYGMTETITHIAVKPLNVTSRVSYRAESRYERSSYELLPNVSISTDNRGCLVINAPKVSSELVVTNDVVEIISDEAFIWKGRYDNVINSGGIKLHPEEIEKKLASCITSRFFVAGIPNEKLGEKLILVVEGKNDHVISSCHSEPVEEKVKNLKSLSKFEKPKEIYFVEEFVETETKKIQRKKTLDLI